MISDLGAMAAWEGWGNKELLKTHVGIYKWLESRTRKKKWVRPIAPFMALSGSLLVMAFRVTTAAKIGIVGLAYTFKPFILPLSKEPTFVKGITFLVHVFPREAVHAVYAPIEAVSYAIVTLINMLLFPVEWVQDVESSFSQLKI